jgi:hypothetical protein
MASKGIPYAIDLLFPDVACFVTLYSSRLICRRICNGLQRQSLITLDKRSSHDSSHAC